MNTVEFNISKIKNNGMKARTLSQILNDEREAEQKRKNEKNEKNVEKCKKHLTLLKRCRIFF